MKAETFFTIECDWFGYIENGSFNVKLPHRDDAEGGMSYRSVDLHLEEAMKNLFSFLKSENGVDCCKSYPRCKFNIYLRFWDGKTFDKEGYPVVKDTKVFSITAKQVTRLRNSYSL